MSVRTRTDRTVPEHATHGVQPDARLELRHGVLAELVVHPAPKWRTVTTHWTLARPLTAYEQLMLPLLREAAGATAGV